MGVTPRIQRKSNIAMHFFLKKQYLCFIVSESERQTWLEFKHQIRLNITSRCHTKKEKDNCPSDLRESLST